jgi:hypothetical protein
MIPFLGVTAHWISENWELKNLLLDFIKLEGSHSGENLATVFLKSLNDFGITTKASIIFNAKIKKTLILNFFKQVLGITTDNASNNLTFLRAIETAFLKENIEFSAENQHVRCLAHVINLAAQQILQTLNAGANIELDSDNIQITGETGETAGILYKVSLQ